MEKKCSLDLLLNILKLIMPQYYGKEVRQLIDDHFNSNLKQECIRTIIQSIDNHLSK